MEHSIGLGNLCTVFKLQNCSLFLILVNILVNFIEKKVDSIDVSSAFALKGDARKMKEKNETIIFVVADSSIEENLAYLQEDWHKAIQSRE